MSFNETTSTNTTTSKESQTATSPSRLNHPHPFDPITPAEIHLAVRILSAAFPPGVSLRYKRIDIQEPIKQDVVPYLEAERLGQSHRPAKPARLLQALFHRLDTGAFFKALLNADDRSIVYMKELPKEVQVREDVKPPTEPVSTVFDVSTDKSTQHRDPSTQMKSPRSKNYACVTRPCWPR